jgi:hypothetical protein
MTYDPLENLLVSAWKELSQYLPEEASHAALYCDLERLMEETDDTGKPTPRAHRAKARLGNAFLVEETNAKSKGKVVKNQADVEKKLVAAVSEALKWMVVTRANAARIAHIESVEERQMMIGENREQHDPESKFALASPFIDKLAKAGTSPSAIGRMPALMVSFIALMINDHAVDPKFKNPDNVWNRIVRSGILEAYLGNLDEEHLKVVARAVCEREEQTNEWAKRAREELDLPAGMEDRFLEAAARIRDAGRSLTDGEVRAYEDAYKLQDDWDIDHLAKMLDMESHEDRIRLRAIYDFIHRAIAPLRRDWKMEMHLGILKREIDGIGPQAKWHKDWKAELRERLEITFERLETMGSIEAFNALLRSGLAVSDADWEFTKRLERDVLDGHFIAFENEVRAACKSDRYFKLYDNRVVYSHEPDYETLDAAEWTGYDWLKEYGAWPGETARESEPGDDVSGSLVADTTEHRVGEEELADDRVGPVIGPRPSTAEDPVGTESSSSESADVHRLDDPSQQSSRFEPAPVTISVPDADRAPPTLPDDRPREIDEPVDDDLEDADPDNYDWQDENPGSGSLGHERDRDLNGDRALPAEPSDEDQSDRSDGPAQVRRAGGNAPHEAPSLSGRPSAQPVRPTPFKPQHDHEEDDWNE